MIRGQLISSGLITYGFAAHALVVSTSWNENKNLLPLQANHQEIFWKANELIQDMLFKT